MWQILPQKNPKILWTMLLGPKNFDEMAKIHHQKNQHYKGFFM
jgi:hypothetical protein